MATAVDILIVGGGPAGLSAATSIVRQAHSTVIFDSQKYRNSESRFMHTLPTWDHRDPAEFRAAARRDFERYGSVTVVEDEVQTIKKVNDHFEATTAAGKTYTGSKVILATGVEDIFPDVQGYAECWVTGVFHCLYCHGWEESGVESSGMLAEGDTGTAVVALHLARQGLRISKSVTLYTNGNAQLATEITEIIEKSPSPPMKVDGRKITKMVKAPERSRIVLHFEDGTEKTEGFLAHKPKYRLRGHLAQQLGCEITPMNTIRVSPPFNQTSVKGVFAAGDCANSMQTLTQALFSGTAVGGGAPCQIQAEQWNQKAIF